MIAAVQERELRAPSEQVARQVRALRWQAALRPAPPRWHAFKRAIDLGFGALTLVLAAPLCLLIGCAIKIVSPGPVFFVQERVGKNGRRFKLYKFRTMVDGAHLLHKHVAHLSACDGPALKIPNDPRLHALGSFLRRSSLDELPQLWNVLRGDMSLVGPRPALPLEVEHYAPHYHQRLTVLPGITGLWQVSGRANVPFRRWMAMDIWYARHWSPLVDLWLLAKTVPAVIRREGAW
jgi:lipopolysaccharide/colanic/teichoic acid biosynthesis glycosyltransferase